MKPASVPGSAKPAQAGKRAEDNAKILPPRSPVDVPRRPDKPDASTPNEAARDKRIVADTRTESNWADGSAPQPRAKNARSSIL
ncbi:hypothetical protein DXK93_05725 [Achromobacter sp. K91]|jgi:hypothetical protein|uniref:Uncharacterized protein n=1 Tax=Achromobacter aegrifaciens TaxID=1287736 RepID=A0AAD2QDD8_ACHAE|nr:MULTISPECIES: hypothetical protein [Achromobacter]PTN49509.1 hypothetical protein DAI43_23055 [Achromobacter xylosoxidans]MBD9380281.1 hypothetical protein [Achromobacter sp. ACM02]MBD9418654.1 hypothetical protein [Achromobacter sp. ACM04]MBD9429041.1 hypothetical protein [Achromobacter sp. ACM03]MBD9473733.1 hypothetical protein [Achromobacter sp. ACM01]